MPKDKNKKKRRSATSFHPVASKKMRGASTSDDQQPARHGGLSLLSAAVRDADDSSVSTVTTRSKAAGHPSLKNAPRGGSAKSTPRQPVAHPKTPTRSSTALAQCGSIPATCQSLTDDGFPVPIKFRVELAKKSRATSLQFSPVRSNRWIGNYDDIPALSLGGVTPATYSMLEETVLTYLNGLATVPSGKRYEFEDMFGLGSCMFIRSARPPQLHNDVFVERSVKKLRNNDDFQNAVKNTAFRELSAGQIDPADSPTYSNCCNWLVLDLLVCAKLKKIPLIAASGGFDDEDEVLQRVAPLSLKPKSNSKREQLVPISELPITVMILPPVYTQKDGSYQAIEQNPLKFGEPFVIQPLGSGTMRTISELRQCVLEKVLDCAEYKDEKGVSVLGASSGLFFKNRSDSKKLKRFQESHELHTFCTSQRDKKKNTVSSGKLTLWMALGAKSKQKDPIDAGWLAEEAPQQLGMTQELYNHSPMSAQTAKKISANANRRSGTQTLDVKAVEFVRELYTSTTSHWYHGFNHDHKLLLESVLTQRKDFGDFDLPAWDNWPCVEDEPTTWPELSDFLDWSNLAIATKVKRVIPRRGRFPPADGCTKPPLGLAIEDPKSEGALIAEAIEKSSIRNAKALGSAFGEKNAATDAEDQDEVSFSFYKAGDACCMSAGVSETFSLNTGLLWKHIVTSVWNVDLKIVRSGVFSTFTKEETNMIVSGEKVLLFEFVGGTKGVQSMLQLKLVPIETIVKQAGSKRPIQVHVTVRDGADLPAEIPTITDDMF